MKSHLNRIYREHLLPVLLLSLLSFLPGEIVAQLKYDYEWLIGYNNAPLGEFDPTSRFAINLISFHNHPPDTIRTDLRGSTGSSNTLSFANSQGELLFYSNGCRLFDHEGNLVPGGEYLNSGTIFEQYCTGSSHEAYPQLAQSMIMLPMDDKDSVFFLIHSRLELTHNTEWEEPFGLVNFDVRLTKIIRNDIDNKYEVFASEVILNQMTSNGNLTAVRGYYPDHWWVIIPPAMHLRNYECIHIGPDGVDTIINNHVSFDGLPFNDGRLLAENGQPVISADGNTYVRWMPHDTVGILIWDFDRTTGIMSNLRHIEHPEKNNWDFYGSPFGGASISPNNRFLYVNTRNNLYQYDLFSEDISSSKVHIAEYNGFTDPKNNFEVAFYLQKLAPNCKIYMSATNTVRFLHVINHPNKKGLDCDFRQHSFGLPGNHGIGLPYHPNYNLDTGYPVCDSNLVSTTWFIPDEPDPGIYLYPNPARDYAIVGWSDIDPVEITLYDMSGREVYHSRMQPGLPEYYLDLSGFGAGVYLVRVRMRDGSVGVERLVISF